MGSGTSSQSSSNPPATKYNNKNNNNQSQASLSLISSRKSDIFKRSEYKYVDEHVRKMPTNMNYGTFEELVAYLTSPPGWTEMAKVRAIFKWVISVNVFNIRLNKSPPTGSPMEYFIQIRNSLTGYGEASHEELMAKLCRMANIPCEIIKGRKKFSAETTGRGEWNAVYVAGSWRFVDAQWASVCVVGTKSDEWKLMEADGRLIEDNNFTTKGDIQHYTNEFYFLPDPDKLIWTHFPDDKKWQLLRKPVTLKQFEDHYYVRERFHNLGMTDVPATKVNFVVGTKDGEVDFTFGLPQTRSSTYRFNYMLYRSRSDQDKNKMDIFLDRFVLFEHREDKVRFALRFPVKGSFRLEICGRDDQKNEEFDWCCIYIINCPTAKANCLPLPDCPPLGWGPMPETRAAGLRPISHKEAEVMSRDGRLEIRLWKERALAFHQMLKHYVIDEATLSKYSANEVVGDEAVVYVRLPQKGEYALKLFAQRLEKEGPAPNVLNYLINSSNEVTDNKPFPNLATGLLGRNEMNSREFGVRALTHKGGKLETKDGKLFLDFEASLDIELVCEMHTNDGMAASKMAKVITNDGGKWLVDLDMPVNGEYSLNVFARRAFKPEQIYSVHSYLIKSSGREDSSGEGTRDVDMAVPTETVETSDREILIPVPLDVVRAVAAVHRRTGNDAPDPNQIGFFSSDGSKFVKVTLKDYGEQMLNLYSIDEAGTLVKNVAKYQINRKNPREVYQDNMFEDMQWHRRQSTLLPGSSRDDRLRQARRAIKNAMDLKDSRKLERAIQSYLDNGGDESDPLITKARHELKMLKAKSALIYFMQQRDKAALDKAIASARAINTNGELDLHIAMAVQLRERLSTIERLRHDVLSMETKTIAEIKSYSSPPDGVHQCMMATFLLLGHQLQEVKVWQRVQALMGKTGKESMMRKISELDTKAVPMNTAMLARKIVSPYSMNQIRDVSAGAATFYIWVNGMVEEVESYGGAEQDDQMRIKS